MKVHLRKRQMRLKKGTSKPRYSLYLDIYYRKGKRKREFLGIYLEPHDDKTFRNEKLKLAENIKAKRMIVYFTPKPYQRFIPKVYHFDARLTSHRN